MQNRETEAWRALALALLTRVSELEVRSSDQKNQTEELQNLLEARSSWLVDQANFIREIFLAETANEIKRRISGFLDPILTQFWRIEFSENSSERPLISIEADTYQEAEKQGYSPLLWPAYEFEIHEGEVLGRVTIYLSIADCPSDELLTQLTTLSIYLEEALKRHCVLQVDKKSGLRNQQYMEEHLEEELSRCLRYERPLSLIFLDMDKLKSINDSYGYDKGDEAISCVAGVLKELHSRGSDVICRYHAERGDEFAILLTETDREKARKDAIRIKEGIFTSSVETKGGKVSLSASIGSFSCQPHLKDITVASVINGAQQAMKRAKDAGGGRVRTLSDGTFGRGNEGQE